MKIQKSIVLINGIETLDNNKQTFWMAAIADIIHSSLFEKGGVIAA